MGGGKRMEGEARRPRENDTSITRTAKPETHHETCEDAPGRARRGRSGERGTAEEYPAAEGGSTAGTKTYFTLGLPFREVGRSRKKDRVTPGSFPPPKAPGGTACPPRMY